MKAKVNIDIQLKTKLGKLKENTFRELAVELGVGITAKKSKESLIVEVIGKLKQDPDPIGLADLYLEVDKE